VTRRSAADLVSPFRRALHQLRLRLFPVRDPWQRLPYEAPLAMFGDGARHGFDWVFEGDSRVAVTTLEDVLDWLATCQYETDSSLFRESDYWQHPHTFEELRRGDCEDFALWAWRKLVELGVDADLVIGRRVPPGSENSRHAWVVFRDGGNEFVLEPIARERAAAVRAVSSVRGEYIPEFGVARDRRRFFFAGYAYFLQNPQLGRVSD
jgi:transglutaminase-like cysteine proteinase BTLCP